MKKALGWLLSCADVKLNVTNHLRRKIAAQWVRDLRFWSETPHTWRFIFQDDDASKIDANQGLAAFEAHQNMDEWEPLESHPHIMLQTMVWTV